MERKTILSEDRKYRYTLWREWDMFNPKYAMFIGLNPSTADETNDDPTIRRCVGFAKEWGYGAVCMTNLFAYRATDPQDMKAAYSPVGLFNDVYLKECAEGAGIVIAAWGVLGGYQRRNIIVMGMVSGLKCLGTTKDGYPKHPLYLSKTTKPQDFKL